MYRVRRWTTGGASTVHVYKALLTEVGEIATTAVAPIKQRVDAVRRWRLLILAGASDPVRWTQQASRDYSESEQPADWVYVAFLSVSARLQ